MVIKEKFTEKEALEIKEVNRIVKKFANNKVYSVDLVEHPDIKLGDKAKVFIGENENKVRMIYEFNKKK